jgi:predicted TIM-barrel fold metal-dependent hydrolase
MMAGKAAEAAGTCRGKGMMGAKLFAVFIRRLWNRPAAFLSTASLAGVLLLIAGAPHAARSQIKYQTDPGASAKKTLPLRDFRPKSMLHLQVHNVLQARFPVIDVHQHVNDAMHVSEEHIPAERLVEMMDRCNIRTIVILTGMWGDKLQKVVDEMVRPYPDRFLVFTQLDWSKIDEPDFGQLMVRQIDDAVRRGARGLKVMKDLGLAVRDKSGKLVPVDDRRLDQVWEECGRLGIPVAIHSSDPEAFFHPVDATNEQYDELIDNPTWQFSDTSKYPRQIEILEAQQRVFARHPNTTFIALHMASWSENLDYVSDVLNRYPNVLVEFGAREGELGRQPRRARRLFLDYPDRILFGTDYTASEEMYRNHFRWLETDDEYFEHWDYPSLGRWMISGLDLPDPVLEKVYHANADRIFSRFKGTERAGVQ